MKLLLFVTVVAGCLASSLGQRLLTSIEIATGVSPEGITLAADGSPVLYAGRITGGGVDRIDLVTGERTVLVPDQDPPVVATGLWARKNRIFVAGGGNFLGSPPALRVYNILDGRQIANCIIPDTTALINDVVTFRGRAYWSDSLGGILYTLETQNVGACNISAIQLPPAFDREEGAFKANGLDVYRGGILLASFNEGSVWDIRNPDTNPSFRQIIPDGEAFEADGIVIQDSRLYVVQGGVLDQVGVWSLSFDNGVVSASKIGALLSDEFNFPTTGVIFNELFYVVNARFGEVPPATANATDRYFVSAVNRFLM